MPFADLRAFVERAEQEGELRRVDGADWNLEIGASTELSYAVPAGPAGAAVRPHPGLPGRATGCSPTR